MIKNVHSENVTQLKYGRNAIIFSASWCDSCHQLISKIEKIQNVLPTIHNVDVDECEDFAEEYDIKSLPVVMILENGEVFERLENNSSFQSIIDAIREF